MSRRSSSMGRVRAAVVGAASAALLLTACSSDGGDDSDELAGVDDGGSQEESEASEEPDEDEEPEPEDDGIDRPDIQVADSLDMVFEDPDTEDPVERAVLADNEQQILAVYEVVSTHRTDDSSISFYTGGDALLWDMDFTGRVLEGGEADAGTARYYNRNASILDDESAKVTYCRDASEVFLTDVETGEMTRDVNPDSDPTYYEAFLVKNETGVWQTMDRDTKRGAAECLD